MRLICSRKPSFKVLVCSSILLVTFYILKQLLDLHADIELDTLITPSYQITATPPVTVVSSSSFTQCPPRPVHLPGPFFHPAEPRDRSFPLVVEEKAPPRCRPPTPLLIAFASNCCLLEQTVLSYIAEGWPASQIVVVDNTGESRENLRGTSTPASHTFLNYTLLRQTYGISIYRSPVRHSFAGLQNLLLELARESQWDDFYTSHQDIVVRSSQKEAQLPFFHNILEHQKHLRETSDEAWAFYFFHYDWLSHVNVHSADQIGPWDVLVPWYPADCDYYSRARSTGYSIFDFYAGDFYDVSTCLPRAHELLFLPTNSSQRVQVDGRLGEMAARKKADRSGRNTWQGRQPGGVSDDYGARYWEMVAAGQRSYRLKWGTAKCNVTRARPWRIWLMSWVYKITGTATSMLEWLIM